LTKTRELTTDYSTVPVRLTSLGLPEALSATVKVPVRVPDIVRAKTSSNVHAEPAANDSPQLLVGGKSPLIETPLILRRALPEFLIVILVGLLAVPTMRGGKFTTKPSRWA